MDDIRFELTPQLGVGRAVVEKAVPYWDLVPNPPSHSKCVHDYKSQRSKQEQKNIQEGRLWRELVKEKAAKN
jgi:hypothetical protein